MELVVSTMSTRSIPLQRAGQPALYIAPGIPRRRRAIGRWPLWLYVACVLCGLLCAAADLWAQPAVPPVGLRILSPADNAGLLSTSLVVRLALPRSLRAGESRLVVRVNGQPAAYTPLATPRGVELAQTKSGDSALRPDEEEWRLQLSVPPRDCEVSFALSADSPPQVLHLRWAGGAALPPSKPIGTMYVLAVGIGSYRGDLQPLDYPRKDAHDFVLALSGQRGVLYRDVVIHEVAEREATRAHILDELRALSRRATDFDATVIFLAGHGLLIDRQYYFVPVDGSTASPATLIGARDIREGVDRIPGKTLLFLDSCHAGGISEAYRERAAPALATALAELQAMGPGVAIFASSMARQTSKESATWQNGVFTKAVVEGLQGAALRDPSGIIRVLDLATYVADRVKQLTNGEQAPMLPVLLADLGQLPLVLHTPSEGGQTGTSKRSQVPLYKKRSFWLAVGGGIVLGGALAITLGILLNSPCGSRFAGGQCGTVASGK